MKRTCIYCKKPLVAIGSARKNGKSHRDWDTRQTHKKCYGPWLRYRDFLNNNMYS